MAEILFTNVGCLFTAAGGPRRGGALAETSAAPGDSLLVRDGLIVALGPRADVEPQATPACEMLDCGGRLVTPGLVDSHTHLVYAGNRADEYEMRLRGATYLEIFEAGGGIHSTVRQTQVAGEEELLAAAQTRARVMVRHGVTTAEVKSGYALTTEGEMKMLRVAARLDLEGPLGIVPTFMGAHALPDAYRERRGDFIALVCEEMIPAVKAAALARYVDVFCDRGAFTVAETEKVFQAARAAGLGLKVHADEFEALGATELAAAAGAVSADHLAVITPAGIRALASSGTAAVLLPGTTVFLGSTHFAPARELIAAGAVVALGSDHNPGSCHAVSLRSILTPAASFLKLQAAEVLHAVTINAAYALGLDKRVGSLEPGKEADIAVFDLATPAELLYEWGPVDAWATIKRGRLVHRAP